MPTSQFYDIINTKDIRVAIPKGSHFSIGTSPYYAHQHGLAVDIYHEISLENYGAFSPISGRVIKMKTLIAPIPRFSGGIKEEHLLLIENKENPEIVFKFLHIKPTIKNGQDIEVGDLLGNTIRNGYFAPWSSPHLHLEIRPKEDSIRASGGKSFSLHFDGLIQEKEDMEENYRYKIPIIIKSIFQEYFLAYFPDNLYYKISPYIGVKGKNLNSNCIIDGGIPIYKRGIALFDNDLNSGDLTPIYFNSQKIGTVWEQRENFGLFKFNQVRFYLNDKEIRGISLFLANFRPLIKVIPYDMDDHNYTLNSTQYLSFSAVP